LDSYALVRPVRDEEVSVSNLESVASGELWFSGVGFLYSSPLHFAFL